MSSKVSISDLIYILYLNPTEINITTLEALYNKNPDEFLFYLKQHFHIDYQNKVLSRINKDKLVLSYSQEQINNCFNDWAKFFHKYINKEYFLSRNITKEQINKFNLGSTHIFNINQQTKQFIRYLRQVYPIELIDDSVEFHFNIKRLNINLYNSPYFSTIPGNEGIVYRAENWFKINSFRNLHKFFVSHAPSYCFNYNILNKYNDIIIVEGVFDVLALDRIGIDNSICFSSTRLSKYQYELIKDKNCLFIFDNDLGGKIGLKYIEQTYNNPKFKYFCLPFKKDFDEINERKIKKFLTKLYIY
jgi:DNA primase